MVHKLSVRIALPPKDEEIFTPDPRARGPVHTNLPANRNRIRFDERGLGPDFNGHAAREKKHVDVSAGSTYELIGMTADARQITRGKKFTVQLILEGFDEDEFNSTSVCKKNFLVPRTLALTATLVINLNGNESVVDFSELSPENMVPLVLKQEKSS